MIDAYRERFGVEPICRVLEVPTSTYYAHKHQPSAAPGVRPAQGRDRAQLEGQLEVYGARSSGAQLQRGASGWPAAPSSG